MANLCPTNSILVTGMEFLFIEETFLVLSFIIEFCNLYSPHFLRTLSMYMPASKSERNTECDGSEMFVIMGLKVAKRTNN